MTISAKIIAASKNAVTGDILYTFLCTYPRIILPEVNTHRVFSRNTSSTRAIPAAVQRGKVLSDPFVPLHIGRNQKGMQAGKELFGIRRWMVKRLWSMARYPALFTAWATNKLGAHKQICNRLIEPWTWTQQLISTTELSNMLLQRTHKDAEPHFQELAKSMMYHAGLTPKVFASMEAHGVPLFQEEKSLAVYRILKPGEWHLPFITPQEYVDYAQAINVLKVVSSARCARVSYLIPETGLMSDVSRDLELYERLSGSVPRHLSPLEHVATPLDKSEFCGNFRGWMQHRKELLDESGAFPLV